MHTLNFDGLFQVKKEISSFGNEISIMCYGWLVSDDQQVIAKGYGSYTHREAASSNGAEYLALIEGLEALTDLGLKKEPVLVIGDAKSVIDQMQGFAGVTSPRIKTLHRKAIRLSRGLAGLRWQWVPRSENKAADRLTRNALSLICSRKMDTLSTVEAMKQCPGFRLISDLMVCQRSANLISNQ
ncbi:MAG: ribonuclease HI family protein [Flexilinea sp.]